MGSIKAIITGWAKSLGILPTSEAEEKLSSLRLEQCMKCPFSKISKVLELMNGQAKYENAIVCNKCGCPSKQKTLVVREKCPVNRW